MSISTTYLLNVALHAVILSIFASLVLLVTRRARHRSVAAIAGLLAVGFLPWLTALRPAPPKIARVQEFQTPAPVLPTWTVAIMPAKVEHPTPAQPGATPAKFVLPDPPTSGITIWATGSSIGMVLLAIALLKVWSWRKSLQIPDDTAWRNLREIAPEIPMRGHFRINEGAASPCVAGLWQPTIVIPEFLLAEGSQEELRWAVRHEIAHWQAGDSRWIILFALIRCVNWWNPLVHHLISRWADAREQLCDLHATNASESRADYGKFLVAMAGRITQQPRLAVAMARRLHVARLKQRILSLLGASADALKPVGRGFVGIALVMSLGGAVGVSALRIAAEEPAKEPAAVPQDEVMATPHEEASAAAPTTVPAEVTAPAPEKPAAPAAINTVRQLKFSIKLMMTATAPSNKNGAILTHEEFLTYLKALAGIKGTGLMTAPSITAKFGQPATIEIIREVLGSHEQIAARDRNSPVRFTGIRFETFAVSLDDRARVTIDAEYHFIPGVVSSLADVTNKQVPGADPDKIKIAKRINTTALSAGQTWCTDLGEIEPGRFLQVFTTVEPADVTGRSLDSFKDGKVVMDHPGSRGVVDLEDGQPVQANIKSLDRSLKNTRGRLRLNAVVINIPRSPELPKNERFFKNLNLATDDSLDALVKHYKLQKRKLKQVEFPLSEHSMPWSEFPGIQLSAAASEDLKRIGLTNDSEKNGRSFVGPFNSGAMVFIDVESWDPSIERRVYITAEVLPEF